MGYSMLGSILGFLIFGKIAFNDPKPIKSAQEAVILQAFGVQVVTTLRVSKQFLSCFSLATRGIRRL